MNKRLCWYVDGACSGNPGPGGCAAIFVDSDNNHMLTLTEHSDMTTNNRMELTGTLLALRKIEIRHDFLQATYTIYSDSAYCVNICNTWMYGWEKAGWRRPKNKPVENLDLVQEIYSLITKLKGIVTIEKVAGHQGVYWNEQADKMAVKAKEEKTDNPS